jgi:hypothetical protein
MNNDPHNDLARYHGFPPLSPPHKPTPTIPQMSDRHEQAILREKLAVWLTRATVWFSIVSMSLFIGSLIYRATVGVY